MKVRLLSQLENSLRRDQALFISDLFRKEAESGDTSMLCFSENRASSSNPKSQVDDVYVFSLVGLPLIVKIKINLQ
jgi:hypothetical protein